MSELVCLVSYTIKNGKRQEFYDKLNAEGIPSATRAEKGCVKYEYFMPFENSDKIFLLEIWQNEDAQKLHCTLTHFLRLQEIKKDYVIDFNMEKFSADKSDK